MADDEDRLAEHKARQRLARTNLEISGNLFPGTVTGKLTPDGINNLVDALRLEGIKFAKV